jgi:hypothetical protein
MKRMYLKRIIAASLALLLTAGWLGSGLGIVLCLSSDGHARLEFAHETDCSDAHSADDSSAEHGAAELASHEQHAEHEDTSHCGMCVDIPIGIGDLAKRHHLILQNAKPSVKTPAAVAQDSSFFPAGHPTWRPVIEARSGGAETLASLRAVILLI